MDLDDNFTCPEIIRGEKVNGKTDVYLVGNLLIYLFIYNEVFQLYFKYKNLESAEHAERYRAIINNLEISDIV